MRDINRTEAKRYLFRVASDMRKRTIERERYPQNAKGDFYVEKDMCITCMMPEVEAPELMGFDQEAGHCYFKKQPATPEELAHAIAAVASSEIQGLRYAGADPAVLSRLVEAGASDCCDKLGLENSERSANVLKTCWRMIWKSR